MLKQAIFRRKLLFLYHTVGLPRLFQVQPYVVVHNKHKGLFSEGVLKRIQFIISSLKKLSLFFPHICTLYVSYFILHVVHFSYLPPIFSIVWHYVL